MNLLDTNGVNYIFDSQITLSEEYFLAPGIADEVALTELVRGRNIAGQIVHVSEHADFDDASYLHQYRQMLNTYGDRSFYNMRGFGDVSILATIHAILDAERERERVQPSMFRTTEPIIVFTGDDELIEAIHHEFASDPVSVQPHTAIV